MKIEGIVGIDEVGRGAWAGPLVAGAVVLPKGILGLKDSKLLTRSQREDLDQKIRARALGVGVGWVWPKQIDEIGLTKAITLAMSDALKQISITYQLVIIDGAFNFLPDLHNALCVPKADQNVPAVSAASVVAKVARDNFMREIHAKFPDWGFDNHVGYGTKSHIESIKLNGICELHRLSYKPLLGYAS